jgi:hypothetical protein
MIVYGDVTWIEINKRIYEQLCYIVSGPFCLLIQFKVLVLYSLSYK